jgi:hypothetical protein
MTQAAPRTEFSVRDIKKGATDSAGGLITKVFFKVRCEYAVYQNDGMVIVQFADDPTKADKQRLAMSHLNAVRTQIDGLIDGWRKSDQFKEKAATFDARVAAALQYSLEGDADGALTALNGVRNDVLAERISWGRFEYLIAASVFSAFVVGCIIAVAFGVSKIWPKDPLPVPLCLAVMGGVVGAFFSISLAITNRTVLTNLNRRDNYADAILRITIGLIAAGVLLIQIRAKLVSGIQIGGQILGGDNPSREAIVMIGFIGGFLERLVPDMLAKVGIADTKIPEPVGGSTSGNSSPGKPPAGGPTSTAQTAKQDDTDGSADNATVAASSTATSSSGDASTSSSPTPAPAADTSAPQSAAEASNTAAAASGGTPQPSQGPTSSSSEQGLDGVGAVQSNQQR